MKETIVLYKADIHSDDDNTFICKFQRPLVCSNIENQNDILIYDETRDFEAVVTLDKKAVEILFPEEAEKTYWLCMLDEDDGHFYPIKQVGEQEW